MKLRGEIIPLSYLRRASRNCRSKAVFLICSRSFKKKNRGNVNPDKKKSLFCALSYKYNYTERKVFSICDYNYIVK